MSAPKLWTRNYIILTVTNLLFFLSFQMVVPVLPLYIESLGGSDVLVGIIVGCGTLGGLAARPVAGRISDRCSRFPVYYGGLILCMVMIFFYPYCRALLFLLVLRILHGFTMGLTTTSSNTLVSDILPRSRFSEGMGYFGMGSVLAMAFSPVIALYLADYLGFAYAFHAAFGIVFLTLVLALFLKRSEIPKIKPETAAAKQSVYEVKAIPAAILLAVQSCGYAAVVTYIPLYGVELGIDGIGVFFTVYSAFVILCRLVAGKVADRRGFGAVIIPALVLSVIGYLFLALSHSLALLLVGAAFIGVGLGTTFPTFQAMALRDVPHNRRGAATATVMSGFDLGFCLGAIIWGAVANTLGYSSIYYVSAALFLVSLLVYLYFSRKSSQKSV